VYIQYYYIDRHQQVLIAAVSEFHGKITSYKQYDTQLKLDKNFRKLKTIMDIARI